MHLSSCISSFPLKPFTFPGRNLFFSYNLVLSCIILHFGHHSYKEFNLVIMSLHHVIPLNSFFLCWWNLIKDLVFWIERGSILSKWYFPWENMTSKDKESITSRLYLNAQKPQRKEKAFPLLARKRPLNACQGTVTPSFKISPPWKLQMFGLASVVNNYQLKLDS